MSYSFEEYLTEGHKRVSELIASGELDLEEKEVIISAFTDELMNSVTDGSISDQCDKVIYTALTKYIDEKISVALNKTNLSYQDLEKAINLCDRQNRTFDLFKSNGWKLPKLNNTKPEKCKEQFMKRQETVSLSDIVLNNDRKITELLKTANEDLSVEACDDVIVVATEQENNFSIAHKKKIELPVLANTDIKSLKKRIIELRKSCVLKEEYHTKMLAIDEELDSLIHLDNTIPSQWQRITELCAKQSELIASCKNKFLPIPKLLCQRLDLISKQYKHYEKLIEQDSVISEKLEALSQNKRFSEFIDICTDQIANLKICSANKWPLPELKNANLQLLINSATDARTKNEKDRDLKIKLIFAGIIVVALIAAFFGLRRLINKGKVQLPFDSTFVTGQDVDVIYDELTEAGFKNITKQMDLGGWLESDCVTSVSVANDSRFEKGDYYKPDVNVVIKVSSPERVYATDFLKDWQTVDYEEFKKDLEKAGFTNISMDEKTTDDKRKDRKIESLSVNGDTYTNEHCYIAANTPIKIVYDILRVGVGHDSSEFYGMEVEDVLSELKGYGFTDITTEAIKTGWAKENTVTEVIVNGQTEFSSVNTFRPDSKIIIKYSSDERIDISEEVAEFSKANYKDMEKALKDKGLTNVKLEEAVTYNPSENHKVAYINIHDELFTSGECHVQKNAKVKVVYYELKIELGTASTGYGKTQYTDLVADLKNRGFTDITLLRSDDLWTGWRHPEGTIKSISIGGNANFTESDSFYANDPVVIVVYTFNGRGCEDITEIEE